MIELVLAVIKGMGLLMAQSVVVQQIIALQPLIFPSIKDFQVDIPDQSLFDFYSPIILTLNNKYNIVQKDEINTESDIQNERINLAWCDDKKAEFHSYFDHNKKNYLHQLLATF